MAGVIGRHNGKVLVLEDDHALIQLFKAILQQAGFEFQSATSAECAQTLLSKQHFDVLVSDLSVTGGVKVFDLVKSVRLQHPEIAVLIVTGFTPEEIASEVATQNIDLLEKPFSPPELVSRVKSLMNAKAA